MLDKIAKILSNYKNYADARITKGTVSSLVSEDRKIKGLDAGISGIGVRVLSKASFGYAWSTRIEDFSELLKKAERLALLNKGDISFASSKPIKKSCGKHYPQLPTEEKLALIKEAEKSAFSSQAKNATLSISDTILEEAFLSSEGSFINQKFSYLYFSALSIAKSGNISQRGIDRAASRKGYGKLDLCKVACNARESAERLLGADSSPKGRFLLVMDPEMTGVFSHEAVGHASEGDSIIERESVLRGKLGKRIANENVTILDDPTFDDFGQYYFDSEGVEAQPVKIIEKGVLKGYMNSRESASALKSKPNGHCRAQNFQFAPVVRMSNTLFMKGSASESELFDVKDGVYVIGMKGGSVDIFSGDFMFAACEAWRVKNGSKEKLLRDVTISGNILEVLKNVESVGKDWGTSPGFCGKMMQSVPVSDGGPHIRVANMKVG